MADEPTQSQSISDDQELAKVLAGVTAEANQAETVTTTPPSTEQPSQTSAEPTPVATPVPDEPVSSTPSPVASPSVSGDLSDVKTEAINELRPLVDKLNVSAEEKFDTYLLLLRSTDDKSLIEPAHETAKLIEDEARRAQALLDIIKEIDFLSQNNQ